MTPAVTGATNWYNQTSYVNILGGYPFTPTDFFASAAYYPPLQEVVLFGGCDPFGACPSNATWVYNATSGFYWTNITAFLPGFVPAAYGESLVWDPAYDSVLMIGGENRAGIDMNWTWGFYGGYWYNWTDFLGPVTTAGPADGTAFAAVAWDAALDEVVVVDGCATNGCTNAWNYVFALPGFLNAWEGVGFGPTSGQGYEFLYWASMAYDPVDQDLVFFGGESFYGGVSNGTYLFDTSSDWINATTSSVGCFFFCDLYPGARYGASMTWDAQLGYIILTEGSNGTAYLADTWYFADGTWVPSAFLGTSTSPTAGEFAAMPSNSTGIVPVLQGGICAGICENSTWVYEVPPELVYTYVDPSTTDTNLTSYVQVNDSTGSGSGPVFGYDLYDSDYLHGWTYNIVDGQATITNWVTNWSFGGTFSFTNAPVGVDTLYAYVVDFFGVGSGLQESSITIVSGVVASPSATVNAVDANEATTISAGASGGSGTYTSYVWSGLPSGCSAPGNVASFSCTPGTSGTYTVQVIATDSYGGSSTGSFTLKVDPALAASPSATVNAVDADEATTISAGASGGSADYTTYAWSGLPSACATPGNVASFTCTPTVEGSFTVSVTVTDSNGGTVTKTFDLTVDPAVAAAPAATENPVDAGEASTISAGASGGSGEYATYAWSGLPAACGTPGNVASFACTPTAAATSTIFVTVTDTNGGTATESFTLTVDPAVTAAPSATVNPVTVQDSTVISAAASGGSGTYSTYAWSGLPSGCTTPGNLASFTCTPTSAGTYTVQVVVTDSNGGTVTKTFSLTVSKAATTTFLGLPSTEGYGLLAGIIVVIAIIAALAALMSRRRKKASAAPPPQMGGSGTTTPASGTGGTPPASPPSGAS